MEANIVSRGDKFIGMVNRRVSGPEFKMPYGDPQVGFALASMVAAHYWDNPKYQIFVDQAFEAAAYLEGQSAKQMVTDSRMTHITDRRSYGVQIRDRSIKAVAEIAAALIETPPEEEQEEIVKVAEVIDIHPPEMLFDTPQDINDVVIELLEDNKISRQLAEGLLIVSGVVDTTNLDPRAVHRVKHMTKHLLGARVERSFNKHSYPTVSLLLGSSPDGIAGQSVEQIIADTAHTLGKDQKADVVVRQRLASEFAQLFYR